MREYKIKDFIFSVGDIVNSKSGDLLVLDRDIIINKKGMREKQYKFQCLKCGCVDFKTELSLNNLTGCPVCQNRITVEGINDIPTTDPWMIPYFQGGYNEAKLYNCQMIKELYFICPDCGRVKNKLTHIANLKQNHSIGCRCGDGISYPEKLIYSVLEQCKINFICEYNFNKSTRKRYDFYLYDYETIIEVNGGQHYTQKFNKNARSVQEEQQNDIIKRNFAIKNGIKKDNYIIIDARKSDIEWIKNSIYYSKLSSIININNINWSECELFARKNLIVDIANLWNKGYSVCEIKKFVHYSSNSITNYLRKAKSLKLCNYTKTLSYLRGNVNKYNPIFCFDTNEIFITVNNCYEIFQQKYGVNIHSGRLKKCIYKGIPYNNYIFKYVDDLSYEEIMSNDIIQKLKKEYINAGLNNNEIECLHIIKNIDKIIHSNC